MSDRLRLRPGALEWREIEGEIVALDLRQSVYLAITKSGTLLWPALLKGASRQELVARLREEFEIEGDVASADVDAFLHELSKHDLLEEV